MKISVYLVLKYWKKHKKNLIALIFSGVLLAAMVFVLLMLHRELYVRGLDRRRDGQGAFDVIISNSDDEILAKVIEGKSRYKYGYINVIGEMGSLTSRFLYGTLHDEHCLYHLPLKEGRMPKTSYEIALDTKAIDALYWVGKCGESITLDGNTYTVTGIINSHKMDRFGSQHRNRFDHQLPTIFIGDSDITPLYRIDFLGDYYIDELMPGMDEQSKELDGREAYEEILKEMIYVEGERWVYCNYDYNDADWVDALIDNGENNNSNFSFFIAYIGIAVAVLSVFSVMRSIFSDRSGWMSTLRRIGAGRGAIARFYAAECTAITVLQTALGILAGLTVYSGILAYKVNVLGEKALSGFSSDYIITNHTRDPFLYAVLFSIAVSVSAYLLCALTSKPKKEKLRKSRKPRPLWRCFERAFADGSVTVVQTVALTLICFSVVMGYLYYTRNNKEDMRLWLSMPLEVDDYSVGGVDLKEEGIAEYYICTQPVLTAIGHQDLNITQHFMTINPDDTRGFGDDTAAKLPEGTVSVGEMGYLFITSDEPVSSYGKEIDLSDESVRKTFLGSISEKYNNFFDNGELGSKHMYQAPTKLTDAGTINRLSEYVGSGEINVEAINSGKEILVVSNDNFPPFSAGEKITLYMAEAYIDGIGLGNITSTEVTVGAVLKIPKIAPAVLRKAAYSDDRDFNFLTTSTGALAMGAPSCTYSEAFAYEEVTGSPFPLTAEASVTSLKVLKREIFVNHMKKLGCISLIFIMMSLLGFSAYFNGIGMKIRAKKYEVSVMRAVGTSVSEIRKRLMLNSLKIPLIASAISYGMVRAAQLIMGKLGEWFMEQMDVIQEMEQDAFNLIENTTALQKHELFKEANALSDKINTIRKIFFLDNGMWEPKAEIPALIVFAMLCVVTFILTAAALKKFKRDIAFDLNSGRTRQ